MTLATIEATRLTIQDTLDSAKTQMERNKLGQFATPTALASDVLEYARTLMPKDQKVRFLDPALGTGSFYSALLKNFWLSEIDKAHGYEIDPSFGAEAQNLWSKNGLKVTISDFTMALPPDSNNEKANLIICNPPYVRHHHLRSEDKLRLQAITKNNAGIDLSGLSGLYCYFLGISHTWLAKDGIAGWLIPSEFMDVNYGRELKKYLLDKVELIRIHRFDPNNVQFDDALVSSAVIWFRNKKPSPNHNINFTYGGSLLEPNVSKQVAASSLRSDHKWTKYPLSSFNNTADPKLDNRLKVGDLFTIKRGIATGSNKFFILTPEQAKVHNLPSKFLVPILPSARYLKSDEIMSESNRDPAIENKLYLLSCNLPENDIKRNYPDLWRYLELGIREGINEQYLCRHRKPWYSQEIRTSAPLLCTYMSRASKSTSRLFRFILNHSQAITANSYLMIYPKPALSLAFKENPVLLREIWEFLNSMSPDVLSREGRVYGGGLYKVEPGELGNVPLDKIGPVLPNDIVSQEQNSQLTLL